MAADNKKQRKPAISMTRSDHERLSLLAESFAERNPAVAEQLFAELDRARLVADGRLAGDIVRMGSTLRFTTDAGLSGRGRHCRGEGLDPDSHRRRIDRPFGGAVHRLGIARRSQSPPDRRKRR